MSFDIRTNLDRELEKRKMKMKRRESFFNRSLRVMCIYDKDCDKKLSFDEYFDFCEGSGRKSSREEFESFDKNESGFLEPLEFMNFYFCLVSKNKKLTY